MINFNTVFPVFNVRKTTSLNQIQQKSANSKLKSDSFEKTGMPKQLSFGMGQKSLKKNARELLKANFDLEDIKNAIQRIVGNNNLNEYQTEKLKKLRLDYQKALVLQKIAQKNSERAERVFILENRLLNIVSNLRKSQEPQERGDLLAQLKESVHENAEDFAEDFIDIAPVRADLKAEITEKLAKLLKETEFQTENNGTVTAILRNIPKESEAAIREYGKFLSQYVNKITVRQV